MNPQEIKSILKEIFYEIAPEIEFNNLDTSRSLRDQVDIDSYDFYRIIVLVNQRTGVNVPDSKVAEFRNLAQLIKYISDQPNHRPQQSIIF
jgi:acyl carrier protein